ncbi:MAG: ornithine cyclodeaminase family protein, partial [Thermoanaerobaculia bacterium]
MQKLLVLSEHEVRELLTMRECIGVMEEALAALARGEAHQPLRSIIRPEGAPGFLGLMPAYRRGASPYYGLKEVCVFPGNPARGLDTHLGAVLLHSGETGELLACVNASAITAIRTAAVSAVATKVLAREDARTLAIIGAGAQGRSHLEAIPLVREIEEVRIFSRNRAHAEA